MSQEIWTVSEQKDGVIRDVSFELLAWGRRLAEENNARLCAIVLAEKTSPTEIARLFHYGADKVYVVEHPVFQHFLVEPFANTLVHLVREYQPEIVLAGATTLGRTVAPYAAVKLHTGLTADCTGLEMEAQTGNLLQVRPAIGGNIMATIKTAQTRPQMATVRPKSIKPLAADPTQTGEVVTPQIPEEALRSRMRYEKFILEGRGHSALEEAEIVVSGGQGLQNSATFGLVEELADVLGAAIGASRPPVDLGWQPYVRQVGLSGRTISPALYIACGISGSVQHLAGIQTAKNIIAINRDPEAPIFQVADFGMVGDVAEVLPALIEKLRKYPSAGDSG